MSASYYEFLESRHGWTPEQRYERLVRVTRDEARIDEEHRQKYVERRHAHELSEWERSLNRKTEALYKKEKELKNEKREERRREEADWQMHRAALDQLLLTNRVVTDHSLIRRQQIRDRQDERHEQRRRETEGWERIADRHEQDLNDMEKSIAEIEAELAQGEEQTAKTIQDRQLERKRRWEERERLEREADEAALKAKMADRNAERDQRKASRKAEEQRLAKLEAEANRIVADHKEQRLKSLESQITTARIKEAEKAEGALPVWQREDAPTFVDDLPKTQETDQAPLEETKPKEELKLEETKPAPVEETKHKEETKPEPKKDIAAPVADLKPKEEPKPASVEEALPKKEISAPVDDLKPKEEPKPVEVTTVAPQNEIAIAPVQEVKPKEETKADPKLEQTPTLNPTPTPISSAAPSEEPKKEVLSSSGSAEESTKVDISTPIQVETTKPDPKKKIAKAPVKKEARVFLDEANARWTAEHFAQSSQPIEITVTENKQTVNVLNSVGSTFVIKGKFTRLVVNSCSNVSVIVDDVIATIELVRGKKLQLQVNSSVPQIAIDKCEGVTLFFQTPSSWQNVEIVTSLSEGVNIERFSETEEEFAEVAVPAQFLSTFDPAKAKFITKPAEHV